MLLYVWGSRLPAHEIEACRDRLCGLRVVLSDSQAHLSSLSSQLAQRWSPASCDACLLLQNAHINELMKKHERSFAEIKNYYNDITHNNLDLIKALKEDVAEMKKREAQNEKLMWVTASQPSRPQQTASAHRV